MKVKRKNTGSKAVLNRILIERREKEFLLGKIPTYEFVRENVMKHCSKMETLAEQIYYLRYCLYRWKNYPEELDANIGLKPTFGDFIREEIRFRKFLIEGISGK